MTAKQRYREAMEWLYIACIGIAGVGLVVITLMIPVGVFMRYVMNNPQSWPEPASVVLMVMLSFLGGAAVYRANVHVAVEALLNAVSPGTRRLMLWGVDACVGATALFMIFYGIQLCIVTHFQTMAEFPVALGGRRLRADSCQRPGHAALPDRARVDRHPAEDVGHVPRRRRGARVAMDILVLLGSFAVLCALGVPVAYALGLSALIAALWVDIPLEAVMLKISDGTDDFALLAIPFFVLAGGIMAEGGMATRLVNLAKVFVGFIRGGLALVNILASTLFGCISGSSVADTASIGSVMIPQMVKAGYPRVFATNVTICGSVQALLIPPSHNAVIYSLAAGGTISVAHLFLAGIFPGLLFGLCLIGLVLWTAHKRGFPKGEPVPLSALPRIVIDALWGLGTVVIIMGGILSGIFTPTESAAVACVYAFLVTFLVYRDYKLRELPRLVHRVIKTVAMVMLLIGFSVAFGYMMAIMQIPAKVTQFFLTISDNKYVFLLLVNILLLLLGTFMDLAPMLLICTPIFLPVIAKFGIDPVHFGMIMILNLGIGLITPPVGPTLFVGCAIGKVTMEQVSKELWPFYGAMCFALLLVTYIPAISLWLPGLTK